MKINNIYNSKKVYEGWFESYFIKPWVTRYADFRDGESRRDCGMSLLAWLVISLGIAGLLMGLVGLLGPEVGFVTMISVGGAWIALSLIPFVALLARTFNGSVTEPRHPKLLGVDVLFIGSCALFLIFGLLMMITTLNSEDLHSGPGTDIDENAKIEMDTVQEEAIFTYQTADIDTAAPATDTLGDLTDPDMVDPNESYDPSLSEGGTPDEPLPNDSIYF